MSNNQKTKYMYDKNVLSDLNFFRRIKKAIETLDSLWMPIDNNVEYEDSKIIGKLTSGNISECRFNTKVGWIAYDYTINKAVKVDVTHYIPMPFER